MTTTRELFLHYDEGYGRDDCGLCGADRRLSGPGAGIAFHDDGAAVRRVCDGCAETLHPEWALSELAVAVEAMDSALRFTAPQHRPQQVAQLATALHRLADTYAEEAYEGQAP